MACNVEPILEDETPSPDLKLSEDEMNGAAKAKRKNKPRTLQLPSLGERDFADRRTDILSPNYLNFSILITPRYVF